MAEVNNYFACYANFLSCLHVCTNTNAPVKAEANARGTDEGLRYILPTWAVATVELLATGWAKLTQGDDVLHDLGPFE